MFSPKRMTPPMRPALIRASRDASGCRPEKPVMIV
jgi:hypothetical protein